MGWTLITGAAKGLGKEIALMLAGKGYPVLIHYRDSHDEALEVVKACRKHGKAECIQGDFTTLENVKLFTDALERNFSDIDNVVNNVGHYLVQSGLETSVEDWQTLFQVNLFAPVAIIQAVLPSLKNAQGCIINIGMSGLPALKANTHCTAYAASKLGLLKATKSFAKELAENHVRVNMVSPGRLENTVDQDTALIPMNRLGTLQETASVVAFLLDKNNSYITGQNIEVAGGYSL